MHLSRQNPSENDQPARSSAFKTMKTRAMNVNLLNHKFKKIGMNTHTLKSTGVGGDDQRQPGSHTVFGTEASA